MESLTVYQFRYFNRATGLFELSSDWATAKAIEEIGGRIIEESAKQVGAGSVSQPSGFVMLNREGRF